MKSERRVKMGFLRLHSLYPIQPPKTSTLNPQIQENPSSIVFVVQIRKKTMASFCLTHQYCKMRNHINNISPLRVPGEKTDRSWGGGGEGRYCGWQNGYEENEGTRSTVFYVQNIQICTYKIFIYKTVKIALVLILAHRRKLLRF